MAPARHPLHPAGERGIALVMALMVMTVLTISISTAIVYSTQNQHSSDYSKAKSYAYILAENGINSAMAILRSPADATTGIGNNALDKNVFCGISGKTYITPPTTNPATQCALRETYDGGYVTWSGFLNQATATWTLTSTGHVQNPVPRSSEATRTMTVDVTVRPTLTQPLNTPVWNYIYSTKPASTPPTCDMTVTSTVLISSPLYVEGNLCVQQSAAISKGPLVVKGRLLLDAMATPGNLGNYVGQAAAPITDVHVGNLCVPGRNKAAVTCKKDGTQNIWATTIDTTAPAGISPPVPNWDNWYINASPGPFFPCTTVTGTPPTFDSGVPVDPAATDAQKLAYKNNSLVVQDLTPGASYSCKTAGGELSWDNSAKKLTISGTIYIDGSLYIQNGALNTYTGQGVIYVSGSFLVKNSSLCGAVYNGACDSRAHSAGPPEVGWDPNSRLFVIVASGIGGQSGVGTADSVNVTSGTLQGAAYGAGAVTVATTSNIDGPIVGSVVNLGQSVTTSFPSITIVPNGMPSNPTAYAQADPPTNYSG